MNISGFSPESQEMVQALLFGEIDWNKQFKTGKGPGPQKEDNYKTGTNVGKAHLGGKDGDKDRAKIEKVNSDSEMLSVVAYPKGPGNPQGGSSKDVTGMRQLG